MFHTQITNNIVHQENKAYAIRCCDITVTHRAKTIKHIQSGNNI